MAEFLLDSLVERRAIVGDASVGCDVAAKKESPQGRGETILQFAGSGMDLSLSRKKKGGALTFAVDVIDETTTSALHGCQTLDLPRKHWTLRPSTSTPPSNRATRTGSQQPMHSLSSFSLSMPFKIYLTN